MRGSIIGCAALLLTGCLEIQETVTIAADGSGTQTMRMKVSRVMLANLQKKAIAARAPWEKQADITAIFHKKKARAELEGAGLKLKRHEVREKRSSKTLDIEVAFDDIGELERSPLGGGRADWILKNGGKGRTALFFYPMGKIAWKEAQVRLASFEKEPTPNMVGFFQKSKATMAGLDLSLTLNLPGRVLKRSKNLAAGTAPNQVVVRIRAADVKTPKDLLTLLAPCYFVEFDSRKCSFGPNPGRQKVASSGK